MKKLILLSILLLSNGLKSQNMVKTSLNLTDFNTENSNSFQVEVKDDTILNTGVIKVKSEKTFEATYKSLITALNKNPGIKIMAEIDHQKNALENDLELKPTRLIIFGNPKVGTPLMQEAQSIGLDLPQKILVWENTVGEVYVCYNDPFFIAERHELKRNNEILNKISKALTNLINAATKD